MCLFLKIFMLINASTYWTIFCCCNLQLYLLYSVKMTLVNRPIFSEKISSLLNIIEFVEYRYFYFHPFLWFINKTHVSG